jgi:anti-sigma factor RsiW
MNDTEITWDILNAYVDGELDRVTSAQVAAAAAHDKALAARIATLSKLKANFARPDIPATQIPPLPSSSKRTRPAPRHLFAIAAGLVLVLAVGLLTSSRIVSTTDRAWLDSALAAQRHWLESASKNDATKTTPITIDASKATRPLDLSDAELKLVYVAAAPQLAGPEATFLGYRGPHGCMVGLWIGLPQEGLGSIPKSLDTGNIRVRAWRDQGTGYALMSNGMDPIRIDRLADAVARLVDPGQIVDDGVRMALRDVTRTGAACRV